MKHLLYKLLFCAFVSALSSANCYALKPSKTYVAVPDTLHLPFEQNTITTSDNFHLNSWTFWPAKEVNNKVTLVLAYADAGNMSWWLSQASIFSQMGYTVVLFDYRGFGASDPFSIDSKMLYYTEFANDLTAVTNFARKKYPGNKTGIWCFSMGTIIASLAYNEAKPDFIIADGFVTNPSGIKEFYHQKNDEIMLPASASTYESALNKLTTRMLIFSGATDKVTTDTSVTAFKKKKPGITIYKHKGGHMEGFNLLSKDFPGSEYVGVVSRFLKIK